MTAKRIPFSRPYPLQASELTEGFSKIIDTRWYTKGDNVKGFEEAMRSYLDVDHAIATIAERRLSEAQRAALAEVLTSLDDPELVYQAP